VDRKSAELLGGGLNMLDMTGDMKTTARGKILYCACWSSSRLWSWVAEPYFFIINWL